MSNLFDCDHPVLPDAKEPIDLDCNVYGILDVEKSLLMQYHFEDLLYMIGRNEFIMGHIGHKRAEDYRYSRWCGTLEEAYHDRLTLKMNECLLKKKDDIIQAIDQESLPAEDKDFLMYYLYFTLYQKDLNSDTTHQSQTLRLSKSIFETSKDSMKLDFVKKYSTYVKSTSYLGLGFRLGISVPFLSNSIRSEFTSFPGLNFGGHVNVYRFFIEAAANISGLRSKKEYNWVGIDYPIGYRFDFQSANLNFGYRFFLTDRLTIAPTIGRLFTVVRSRVSIDEEAGSSFPAREFKIRSNIFGGFLEFDLDSRFSNSIQNGRRRPLKDYAASVFVGFHYTNYYLDSEYLNFQGGSYLLSIGIIGQFQGIQYKNHLEPHKKVQYLGD